MSARSRLPVSFASAGGEITLRFLAPADKDAILAFAGGLPEHDRLFLRRDITKPDTIDNWLRGVERGTIKTIVADRSGTIEGYASLDRGEVDWSPHVAELRVLVSSAVRGQGLGRVLIQEAFTQALSLKIEKIVAQMTVDQKSAIASLEEVGFKAEAMLRDHVKDRSGQKHDLIVLSHDVARFQEQIGAYGLDEALAP